MPVWEHVQRFNAPVADEVAIVIVGKQFQQRHIILHRRNYQLTNILDTHWCCDTLQYTIIIWDNANRYHFNVKITNPVNGEETKKSGINYYSILLRIRENEDNHILKYCQ